MKILIKRLMLLAILAVLGGCATPLPYGNFSPPAVQKDQAVVANDALHALMRLYPPAHTCIAFQQPVNDAYGKQLVKQLRQVGYAVREYTPENTKGPPAGDQTSILKFDYIVDVPEKATTRVTLLIDNHILTRGYKLIDGVYMPIGDWAYKGDTGGKQT